MTIHNIEEARLLRRLRAGDETALEKIIDQYSSYVQTIIYNIIGTAMTHEDMEEIASDVFLILWEQSERVEQGKLKAYLSAISRNTALKKLRQRKINISLDEDDMLELMATTNVEQDILGKESEKLVTDALSELGESDREIFLRHYYYCQTVEIIAEEMNMNPSTVKARLMRGRKKLKLLLEKGGYIHENT